TVDDEGRQRIGAGAAVEVPVVDLAGHPPAERQAALAALRARLSHQILPAATGPLYDVRVARLGGGRWRLFLGLDLLVCDIASGLLLAGQALALYDDPGAALPAAGLTFREYVLTTAARRDGAAVEAARRWWRAQLESLPPAPSLPWVSPPPGAVTRFARRQMALAPDRWAAFRASARRRGLTPAAALATAYAEVLAGWSRRAPMTLNLTVFDRRPIHPDVDRLVGDFTETLLLAVDPGPALSFAARAGAVQETLWGALEHGALGGVEVLRMLNRARPGAVTRMPVVFTAALGREGAPAVDPRIAEGLRRIEYGVSQTPQVWLDHQAIEVAGWLQIHWDAVEARFPPGVLDAMFAAWGALLGRLADEDGAWDRPVDVTPPGLAARWAACNDTAGPRAEGTLWSRFAAQAAAAPGRAAVVAPGRALDYGELAARAAAVHAALGAVEPGERVGIVMRRHWAQAVAALGILRAGGAYVPLDAGWPAARVAGILARAGVTRVATTADLLDAAPWGAGVTAVAVDTLPLDGPAPAPAADDPARVAYVIYTSGSTGEPKGVVIDHAGAVNTLDDINRRFAVGADDRALGLSALSFDLSVYDLFGLFAAGGAVVLPDAAADRDPAAWLAQMQAERVTLWNSVPALMEMLVEHAERAGARWPESLRHVLLSGDWIPVSLPDRIRALGEAVTVTSLGGATEASIWSIAHPIGEVDHARPSIPYGRPLTNQTMWVLDPLLRPCPEWAVGELYIGGVGVALGYAGDPAQTAARFVTHPESGERLYRTGDLGRLWPDGTIEFLGREDGQVKIGGHRIELGEITAALERHPAVRAAVVDARGEPPGPRRLVAYVVPDGGALDAAALRAHLSGTLPGYMVPEQWVALETLPLGANGKVDRRRLPAPAAVEAAGRAPRAGREQAIAALWAGLLGRDDIGAELDFFAAGGDSLAAVRLVAEVRRALGVYVPLRRFFAEPTVAALAAL
ncbi:MAG: amino acid adenylation domain-containing protein, partial [bacterium]